MKGVSWCGMLLLLYKDMPRKKTNDAPKPMGRPKKQINQKQFEELCNIQCTHEEVCAVLDVCADTLEDWCKETYGETFSKVFKAKREGGKASLRRRQWNMAETNPTMAIWLGKQYLGQKDKNEETNTTEALLKNMQTLTEALVQTHPNRRIEDFE